MLENTTVMNDFFQLPLLARLATVSPNCKPHVVPLWYRYENGTFYFSTGENSQKAKNIKNNSAVALSIDVAQPQPKGFIIFGQGSEYKCDITQETKKIAQRYLPTSQAVNEYVTMVSKLPNTIFQITPHSILNSITL